MRREDFERQPCSCPECRQAGVSELEQVRDPRTGAFLHGYGLKRWHEARERFKADLEQARAFGQWPKS